MNETKDFKAMRPQIAKAVDTQLDAVKSQFHLLLALISSLECCGNCQSYDNQHSICSNGTAKNCGEPVKGDHHCSLWNIKRKNLSFQNG